MRLSLAAMALVTAALTCSARAADPGATENFSDYTLVGVQPCQLKATTIVYQTIHVNIAQSGELLKKTVIDLYDRLKAAHITPKGGPLFVFKGIATPDVPMDIDVGVPVEDKTAAPEGCDVRVLDSVPSVIGIFKGPFTAMNRAYPDFFRQLVQLGKTPGAELRQRTLYFEGENSDNNIVLMEMVTKE
jgi:hypothetical protein